MSEKDEVRFEHNGYVLHMSLFSRVRIGPPSGDVVGRLCPICRTPFASDTLVHVCHNCGTAMHLEGEERGEDERLVCASLCSECPICHAPIVLEQGYSYVPQA